MAADACQISYDDGVGRHVKATRNIEAGEVLIIGEAIASHLSPFKMKSNCVHCFRKFKASVLPSPINGKARFCCLLCLREAMRTYHPIESTADITDLFYG